MQLCIRTYVIVNQLPNGIQSIIYSSVNKWAAEDQCVRLNAAFQIGTRYTYRTGSFTLMPTNHINTFTAVTSLNVVAST